MGAQNLRVHVNSWPKAGTHVLLELVRNILGDGAWMLDRDVKSPESEDGFLEGVDERIRAHKAGFAFKGHLPWSAQIQAGLSERGFQTVMIVRDLRDVACSTLRWMRDLSPDWPASRSLLEIPTDEGRLLRIISGLTNEHPFDRDSGIDWSAPLPLRYSRLTDWAANLEPGATLRYEDLLGVNGQEQQLGVITKALGLLGVRTSDAVVRRIASAIYNPDAITFHTGSSGGWAQEFNDSHRRLFLELGGDEVNARFGYHPTPLLAQAVETGQ